MNPIFSLGKRFPGQGINRSSRQWCGKHAGQDDDWRAKRRWWV